MNKMNHRYYLLFPLLLIISLLCSCARSSPRQETTYETYTASSKEKPDSPSDTAQPPVNRDSPEAKEAQAAFDKLCDHLFREQV